MRSPGLSVGGQGGQPAACEPRPAWKPLKKRWRTATHAPAKMATNDKLMDRDLQLSALPGQRRPSPPAKPPRAARSRPVWLRLDAVTN